MKISATIKRNYSLALFFFQTLASLLPVIVDQLRLNY